MARGGYLPAIGAEGQVLNASGVGLPTQDLLAGSRVPDLDESLIVAGSKTRPGWAERHGRDRRGMPQREKPIPFNGIPDHHRPIPAARGQTPAVRAIGHLPHTLRMPLEGVQIRQLAETLKVIPFKVAKIHVTGVSGHVTLEQVPGYDDA